MVQKHVLFCQSLPHSLTSLKFTIFLKIILNPTKSEDSNITAYIFNFLMSLNAVWFIFIFWLLTQWRRHLRPSWPQDGGSSGLGFVVVYFSFLVFWFFAYIILDCGLVFFFFISKKDFNYSNCFHLKHNIKQNISKLQVSNQHTILSGKVWTKRFIHVTSKIYKVHCMLFWIIQVENKSWTRKKVEKSTFDFFFKI